MATWMTEDKPKILNLLGLPVIKLSYKFAHNLQLLTLIFETAEPNCNKQFFKFKKKKYLRWKSGLYQKTSLFKVYFDDFTG